MSFSEQPEFLRLLTPASQLMVKRRLEIHDFSGADFLMQSESAETRRKYEIWKASGGSSILGRPCGSGPGRLGILETDLRERRRTIEILLNSIARRDRPSPAPRTTFTSSIVFEKEMTVELPIEMFTTTAVIQLS